MTGTVTPRQAEPSLPPAELSFRSPGLDWWNSLGEWISD